MGQSSPKKEPREEKFSNNYESHASSEAREGYTLEKFSSKENLYKYMEEVRQSNSNEAHGFVIEKEGQFLFYYQLGDDAISVELPQDIDYSWHSHPDNNISEIGFKEQELPDNISEDIKAFAKDLVEAYASVDEISPQKISLVDMINIVTHSRKGDLISLPQGLLDVKFSESEAGSLVYDYANDVNEKWKSLVSQVKPKLKEKNLQELQELRINMVLEYYDYAITRFSKLLEDIGYEKMEQDNFLEILEKIGLAYNFKKI